MKNVLSLVFLFTVLSYSCKEDDESLTPTNPCPDIYILDLSYPLRGIEQVWLTDAAGAVLADSTVQRPATGVEFFNYQNACESVYDASFASEYLLSVLEENPYRQDIRHIAGIPSGSGLDLSAYEQSFGARPELLSFSQVLLIPESPAYQSIELQGVAAIPLVMAQNGDSLRYRLVIDNTVLEIESSRFGTEYRTGLLALQKEEDASWWGSVIDYTLPSTTISFADFEALSERQLQVNPPSGVDSFKTEISWIADDNRPVASVVGVFKDQSQITCYVPDNGAGFLIKTTVYGTDTYLRQQFFPTWPTEITLDRSLEMQQVVVNYPSISVQSNLGDIALISGKATLEERGVLFRKSIFDLTEGTVLEKFSPPSPAMIADGLLDEAAYEATFTNQPEVSVFHYPQLNGGYPDFLRSAFRISNNREEWLKTQVYEGVRRTIN